MVLSQTRTRPSVAAQLARPRLDAKRAADLVVAGAGLVMASPVLAVCAAAVKLGDGGPVLFRQTRVGLRGRPFRILKLRSMRVRSTGAEVTSAGDSRVTGVGRVLRATKLDELPQLVNVVAGDMSLVGPRPEVPRYVAAWSDEDRELVLSVRPGITDPASLAFVDEEARLAEADDPEQYYREVIAPAKLALCREYVRTRSLAGDARIVLQTLAAVAGKVLRSRS
ncbi:MAG: sugar transferase [Actinomycetia bacterium]|nr:sugar transferase [Actinomycetes bacterium]